MTEDILKILFDKLYSLQEPETDADAELIKFYNAGIRVKTVFKDPQTGLPIIKSVPLDEVFK